MLNFEEELQKFKPSLEIDDIEDALYQETLAGTGNTQAVRSDQQDQEEGGR